ncbi:MAG TPA: cytochrome c5 family protein [Gammaproteobacteria bacterium]|nr:cytochrome c5 family protein [Gammaproteobacteria bacterium]|tara:strand:- start:401 stop:1297 length:897 start_codon:yes stop_codon:yes gene_type:complete
MGEAQKSKLVRDTTAVVALLLGTGFIAFLLAWIIFGKPNIDNSEETVAKRIAPIGTANIGDPFLLDDGTLFLSNTATTATEPSTKTTVAAPVDPGKAAYDKICFACHDAGVGGAPKIGFRSSWGNRPEKGSEMLVINAINGFTGEMGIMPPKGGLPSLSDDEVRAAVTYMLATIDGSQLDDTSTPATNTNVKSAPIEIAITPTTPATATPVIVDDGRGKEVYDSACFICHATGVAGAPKIGDEANWKPRIEQGIELLYSRAIKGFMGESGLMPPKGGRMDFSDEDVNAAVDYMVIESQ